MENKHEKKKSKAPVIIIIAAAVAVIAAAVFAVLFFSGAFKNNNNQQTATVAATTVEDNTVKTIDGQVETKVDDHSGETHSSKTDETAIVVVPTEPEGNITYFSGSYTPNGTVVDTFTGQNATLREVFGSGYDTDGKITFNDNGTFSDAVPSHEAKTGGYVVQNEKIIATYSDDKNMEIVVNEWNGNTPAQFYIVYAGYKVYFG